MQTRLASLLERLADLGIGFIGSLLLMHFVIRHLYGLPLQASGSLEITVIYTAWSLARGYGTRRLFNRFRHQVERFADWLRRPLCRWKRKSVAKALGLKTSIPE